MPPAKKATKKTMTTRKRTQRTLREEIGTLRRGRPPKYTEQERLERARLLARAQHEAMVAVREQHRDEYEQFYARAKREAGL